MPPSAATTTCPTSLDIDTIRDAYEDVRADNSETKWAVFKFDEHLIRCADRGDDFAQFREHFADDERAFGYIRLQTGDEMSKRQKFVFLTFIGPMVSVIQRARMSIDKSVIKTVISNFAIELQMESQAEVDQTRIIGELQKAGGANYGTGVREM